MYIHTYITRTKKKERHFATKEFEQKLRAKGLSIKFSVCNVAKKRRRRALLLYAASFAHDYYFLSIYYIKHTYTYIRHYAHVIPNVTHTRAHVHTTSIKTSSFETTGNIRRYRVECVYLFFSRTGWRFSIVVDPGGTIYVGLFRGIFYTFTAQIFRFCTLLRVHCPSVKHLRASA